MQQKYLNELTAVLKTHKIVLHKNTKNIGKLLTTKDQQKLNYNLQANYIALGSEKISEEQLKNMLLFFSTKNTSYMSFSIFYQQKFLRPRVFTSTQKRNNLLLTPSILYV